MFRYQDLLTNDKIHLKTDLWKRDRNMLISSNCSNRQKQHINCTHCRTYFQKNSALQRVNKIYVLKCWRQYLNYHRGSKINAPSEIKSLTNVIFVAWPHGDFCPSDRIFIFHNLITDWRSKCNAHISECNKKNTYTQLLLYKEQLTTWQIIKFQQMYH